MRKRRLFYRRSGIRISRADVRKTKESTAQAHRIGKQKNGLRTLKSERLANRIEQMAEEEFCRYTGVATYR